MEGLFFGVDLSQSLQKAVDKIIADFNKDPKNPRYFHPFCLSSTEFELPLWIYIWAPLEQHGKSIKCIQHKSKLTGHNWKSVVTKKSKNNPRVLYCVSNNIILIQRSYVCGGNLCTFLSASKELMNMFEEQIEQSFHFKMYHRSGYSYRLIDLVFQMISQGNNFKQIAQMIANLRVTNFQSEHLIEEEALETSLCSFPSACNLEVVFLDVFQQLKDAYRLPIFSDTKSVSISTSHSLKICKNVGGSSDKKYVMNDMKLLLVFDENHSIANWKLTEETTDQNALNEFLVDIKSICPNLTYVVANDCCEELYSEIFGDIPVKLHPNHAVGKISNLFPKYKTCANTRNFIHELSLILRNIDDTGTSQTKPTADKAIIFENLERFLVTHQPFLSGLDSNKFGDLVEELNNIKVHIERGCLSYIDCGYGTYNNEEALQRIMDQSLIKGRNLFVLFIIYGLSNPCKWKFNFWWLM